jgi:CrcB protein
MNLMTFFAIGLGGFLGAVSRVYLNGVFNSLSSSHFPFGTLGVNIIGSFFIGILFAYFSLAQNIPENLKLFLISGFLGALTTYSTFALESFTLLQNGHFSYALINIVLNALGTIVFAGIGWYFVKMIMG